MGNSIQLKPSGSGGSPNLSESRSPTVDDTNYDLSSIWVNEESAQTFVLIDLNGGLANWVELASGTGADGGHF
jgi:hypothetical protein